MSEMVLSNETVLIEQYQTTEALVRAGGGSPLKLNHVQLSDIQQKPQTCLLFNIWRCKKSVICSLHDPRSFSL